MSALLDSSVLIAALAPDEDRHAESLALLMQGEGVVYAHALLETFSTLTSGRLGVKVDADFAAQLLSQTVMPRVQVVELTAVELLAALRLARKHGARSGAVYDFMHLVAARKAGTTVLYTLNLTDFEHLRREGDPEIRRP
ncbi:MAG: type II toxin-antitoxin system VapC family toxin [Prosthecobacter sp.]|uniref:type II toxin-antitoxin system VapC family toxin n=1 Tax=Prosthecobacter sp. TaxID=1965333 RepID=UPI0039026A4D